MRKYLYIYDSPTMTYRTCKINDLIDKVNMMEGLDDNDRLTKNKIYNYFGNKTKKPNYIVSRCLRSRI